MSAAGHSHGLHCCSCAVCGSKGGLGQATDIWECEPSPGVVHFHGNSQKLYTGTTKGMKLE